MSADHSHYLIIVVDLSLIIVVFLSASVVAAETTPITMKFAHLFSFGTVALGVVFRVAAASTKDAQDIGNKAASSYVTNGGATAGEEYLRKGSWIRGMPKEKTAVSSLAGVEDVEAGDEVRRSLFDFSRVEAYADSATTEDGAWHASNTASATASANKEKGIPAVGFAKHHGDDDEYSGKKGSSSSGPSGSDSSDSGGAKGGKKARDDGDDDDGGKKGRKGKKGGDDDDDDGTKRGKKGGDDDDDGKKGGKKRGDDVSCAWWRRIMQRLGGI